MKVYLCGGINGLSDDDAKNWRDVATRLLGGLGHTTLDPMRRDYRGVEDDNVDAIISGDLDDIDRSDALIVNATRPSWGTAMEVFYAATFRPACPVVIIHPADKPVSPWLRGHSTTIVSSLPEAVAHLEGLPV